MAEDPVKPLAARAQLRREFRTYEDGVALENARRATVFAAVFMLAGWSLDLVVYPGESFIFLLVRALSAILLAGIFYALGKSERPQSTARIARGIALIPLVSICAMIAIEDGGESTYYAGLNLILVGLSLLLRWSFKNSLTMIAACFACYLASVAISSTDADFPILFGNLYFLFVTSVFVLAGSYFYENLRFSEYCLNAEVERSRELLKSQNQKLSELDEAKTRFFANISHELRTPLTIMLGITEQLKRICRARNSDPAVAEMTTMLEQNGLRLLKLIDDLLDLVRFDTGHAEVKPQPTDIAAHINGLLRSLRHLSEQDKVALLWECDSAYDAISIDRDKFDKILLNLVINAIKFTPSGGTIQINVTARDNTLTLTVSDNGVGISPEVLPRIFERFWQVDTSSTRKFQGAGIGLALVRALAEAMHGSAKAESQLGHGTTFTIELPTEAAEPCTEDADNPLKEGGKIAELHRRAALAIPGKIKNGDSTANPLAEPIPTIGKPNGARPLVLIADDEPDIRRFLRMQMSNVDVIEARDGAEALEIARQKHPQVALVDHMMPEIDGVEVCRQIRANHSTRGMALIMLTARADEQTKLNALEAGANDFLVKPFSTAELALRLENQIAMARIRHEISELNTELNAALEQIKDNEVLMVRNEKLSSLGRMSAGIIHEINNPLNYAGAGIHALATFTKTLPEEEREEYEDILKDIREGIERVSQIVIDLRKFTRGDSSTTGDADLCEILGRAHRMVKHQIGKGGIEFKLETPDVAIIRGNPNQLVQVFINFFQNSVDAINQRIEEHGGDTGHIEASIKQSDQNFTVTLRDNGIGIPEENIQKIFDPFFTSKDVGKGMGLGLAITHQILKTHHAHIDIDSKPGEFTEFRLIFPIPTYGDEDDTESVLDQSN